MDKLLTYALAAGLLLSPAAVMSQDYGSPPPQAQQAPPVAQPLVREGDFAIKLAAKLDLGLPSDEATAEDMLAKAGVVPKNGWLSDYPVTPEILGQLQAAVARAASEGSLPMTSEEATRGLYSLASEMNLPVPAGWEGAAVPGAAPGAQSPHNPTIINNYYYDSGPPVVTYYEPPVRYAYLYAWVPYPVWWFGFWFPGFYICHNFTTTVVVSHVHAGVHIGNRRAVVSNRVIDPVTRRVAVVDPVVRTGRGDVRSSTILRAGNGRTFATIEDLRRDRGPGRSGPSVREPSSSGPGQQGGIRNSADRRRTDSIRPGSGEQRSSGAVRRQAGPNPGQSFENRSTGRVPEVKRPSSRGERAFRGPAVNPQTGISQRREGSIGRNRAPADNRIFNAPSRGNDRSWSIPRSGGGSFNAPSRGNSGPSGEGDADNRFGRGGRR